MTDVDGPARAGLALGPVFRRVAQSTRASPVDTDVLVEPPHGSVNQRISIRTGQPVESLADKDARDHKQPVTQKSRLIIAVDFGTTYSTVAYAKINPGVDSTTLSMSDIFCIDSYENADGNCDARGNTRADNVPTKLLYFGPKAPESEQSDTDSDLDDCISDMDIQPTLGPDSNGSRRRKRGRNSFVPTARRRPRTTWSRPEGVTVKWGFSVQNVQRVPEEMTQYDEKETVELTKLTLGEKSDEDNGLRKKRAELTKQIERLRSRRIIQDRDHLLRDYLARLLKHAKGMLEEERLLDAAQLEYVLCVPVSWSESACRTMHDAMAKAIQACKLGVFAPDLIPDLFIVSEPEAAAQYVIASLGSEGQLRQGEVFVILDAGGGTVDITTYRVTSDGKGPLRLQGEMIAPDGAMCGSSLITERYLLKIRDKLGELDPTGDSNLLDGIAIAFANHWDLVQKPRIDVAQKKSMNLKSGGRQWHRNQVIQWTEDEIRDIFQPSLEGTTKLLEKQLLHAKEKDLKISKVIVVGGFGESPSLKARILQVLSSSCNGNGGEIEAIWPKKFPTSAVARGAVLRALDKRNGPSRISRSSFGFLRHEVYEDYTEHVEAEVVATRDAIDNGDFVRDTIYWQIQAGEELLSPYETKPILSYHTFMPWDVRLICVEKLYISQRNHRSHFQCHHPENQGASLLSFIEVDVSDLKKEFPLEEKVDFGPRTKLSNRSIRVVQFDLVIIVEGKLLKYEARWPPGARTPDEVRVRKSGYVSLAPSFAPGTE